MQQRRRLDRALVMIASLAFLVAPRNSPAAAAEPEPAAESLRPAPRRRGGFRRFGRGQDPLRQPGEEG